MNEWLKRPKHCRTIVVHTNYTKFWVDSLEQIWSLEHLRKALSAVPMSWQPQFRLHISSTTGCPEIWLCWEDSSKENGFVSVFAAC